MSTTDTDFSAFGAGQGGNPAEPIGFWATLQNNNEIGGFFVGTHIGAKGSVGSTNGGNFGVVGSVGYGDPYPFPEKPPFPAGAGPVGVWGTCKTGPGVVGTSSPDAGVVGLSGDVFVSGGPAGVVGTSQNRAGVYGVSSANVGVVGVSDTSIGVEGTSITSIGVGGSSTNSSGVMGETGAPPTNYAEVAGVTGGSRDATGVYGASDTHYGVLGTSKSSVGVQGIGELAGVYGMSSTGNVGVHGDSANSFGVYGTSSGYIGVFGSSGQNWGPMPTTIDPYPGIWGTSRDHIGVLGTSTNRAGLVGYSTTTYGIYAEGAQGGAYFKGDVTVVGTLTATVTKNAVVPFPDGSHRLMHCMESPEHWFEDFGAARLKRGRAVVKLDADFAKTIKTGDYRVFLTPEGDCRGLYIKSKRRGGFEVRELQGGTSNVAFSYRIVGRRQDIKGHKRFARIDITPPMRITKRRTVGQTAARAQAVVRKLRAAMKKHAVALRAKPARGRKVRLGRQRKARE